VLGCIDLFAQDLLCTDDGQLGYLLTQGLARITS
jgi:hypothetical protein